MLETRRSILRDFGFAPDVADRLLGALTRPLPATCPDARRVSLGNELFVPDWIACCLDASTRGAVAALQDVLFQLNFPVAGGVSGTPEYQALALAGSTSLAEVRHSLSLGPATWEKPDALRVFMHETGAGLLPVIAAGCRADFVTLVRALGHRNEPAPVPASMGSNFLNGLTNRRRYLLVREALATGVLSPAMRDPSLWKDRLLLLSPGPYSGVAASEMGLADAVWIARSTAIRLHHESCHYAVRRLFPALKFGIQDELVADFAGLTGATGQFRADEFLRFMGLENFPAYRAGGRFENYHADITSDPATAEALRGLLVNAARHVERFFSHWDAARFATLGLQAQIALTHVPLEVLASETHAAPALADALGTPA